MNAIYAGPQTRADSGAATRRVVVCATASVAAAWVGLLGPAWTYVPPQPQADLPAGELTFAALSAASADSTSAVQAAYFGWLAWCFAVTVTVLMVLLSTTRSRPVAALCVSAGVVQLAVTVLAVKGPLPWSVFVEGISNIRLGAALALAAIVLLIGGGLLVLLSPTARTPIAE
ncbi:MAG: hypothetical protein EOP32_04710 [Rhodococcus sp. (in: high G+C Gram-positive bacteria)]|nr:MAG: hypothetical protein EOP32_04710 [Rhodococcus sp. (in: high G+C Gram-positive bacteria)]